MRRSAVFDEAAVGAIFVGNFGISSMRAAKCILRAREEMYARNYGRASQISSGAHACSRVIVRRIH